MKIGVWVGTSTIAGQGLFAGQHIRKDTRILRYIGEKIAKKASTARANNGNASIFQWNARYDLDGNVLKNTARSINHSCDPTVRPSKRNVPSGLPLYATSRRVTS